MAIPAFLYTGPEFGQKNDAIKQIKKNHSKQYGDIDEYSFYVSETKLNDIFSLLQNGSLFSSGRFALIKNAELIKKKEDIALVAEWAEIAKKDASTCIIFVSDENAVDKKLSNLIPKENQKIFWELFENQKEAFVQNFFRSMGLQIEMDAVDAVLELVENNTDAIKRHCERFAYLFPEGSLISQKNVEEVLVRTREESAFTLFDALADSEKAETERLMYALDILQNIMQSKSRAGIQIIAGLSYAFRKLALWHQLHENNRPTDFDLKIKGFSSKRAQKQYRKAQGLWTAEEVSLVLALLSKTDMELRSANAVLEETLMTSLVYGISTKRDFYT